jgi:hypothetical protein
MPQNATVTPQTVRSGIGKRYVTPEELTRLLMRRVEAETQAQRLRSLAVIRTEGSFSASKKMLSLYSSLFVRRWKMMRQAYVRWL